MVYRSGRRLCHSVSDSKAKAALKDSLFVEGFPPELKADGHA